jgi:hypothetical protein
MLLLGVVVASGFWYWFIGIQGIEGSSSMTAADVAVGPGTSIDEWC